MVLQKARELGIELSQSNEFKALVRTRGAMERDAALMEKIDEYGEIQRDIAELMQDQEDTSNLVVARSHDLELLQAELMGNAVFTDMMNAQNDFQQLMNQVNAAIGACIGLDIDEGSECAHDCGSCSGCKH